LNFVLRIPSIPHEKGRDSFYIHSLASSISSFGSANWWEHWLSIFGYYPYSYASAAPFSLSGLSQLTLIDLEKTILLFSIILGLFSIFVAYILAGKIYDDFLFKYLMAFIFSTSQGIMLFTTWEISSRGFYLVFLPFFLYLTMMKIQYLKFIGLLLVVFIFIFSAHHYAVFLIPIMTLLISLKLISKKELIVNKSSYLNYMCAILFIIVLLYPFFSKGMITAGSRYGWIQDMIISNIRLIGPMFILSIGGFISILFKQKKEFNEWYFLCMTLLFVPFSYNITYGTYVILLYVLFLASVGVRNLFNVKNMKISKLIPILIVVIFLSSVCFSSYYNHFRTGKYKDLWYMEENTYNTAKWIDNYIDKEKRVLFISEDRYKVRSIALQHNGSSIVQGGTEGLTYGFINRSIFNNLERVPITSSYFFTESPYVPVERDKYRSVEWYIANKNIDTIKDVYELNYILQSITYRRLIGFSETTNDKIYSTGTLEIFDVYE
jgi:hypothetical protein